MTNMFSRESQSLPTDCTTSQEILAKVWNLRGDPQVDLFATRSTKRLLRYHGSVRDPDAFGIHAMAISVTTLDAYAYPPVALLHRVLA